MSVFACAIFITPTCLWLENSTISSWVKRTNSWLIKHFNYNHTVQILERAFLLQEQQLLYIHTHSRGEGQGWTFNCTNFLQHTERHQDDSTWVNAQKQTKHVPSICINNNLYKEVFVKDSLTFWGIWLFSWRIKWEDWHYIIRQSSQAQTREESHFPKMSDCSF